MTPVGRTMTSHKLRGPGIHGPGDGQLSPYIRGLFLTLGVHFEFEF